MLKMCKIKFCSLYFFNRQVGNKDLMTAPQVYVEMIKCMENIPSQKSDLGSINARGTKTAKIDFRYFSPLSGENASCLGKR